MIDFNKPNFFLKGLEYIKEAICVNKQLNGDGPFGLKCSEWMEKTFGCCKVMLTTSCTHGLELSALLCGIQPGDEVIMPSFTFVSTANAFALRGAKIKFVDIEPGTMNMNCQLLEAAITKKTKAIVPVHYAGVACEMDVIMDIAREKKLFVVEDAAQAMMAKYKGRFLGTIGDFGTYSFHETKNYTMGEGGTININREEYIKRGEVIREKGTNRKAYYRGEIDKYSWTDLGSSYLPSELNAAYLYAQLEQAELINRKRLFLWNCYYDGLQELAQKEVISIPHIPKECEHNGHIFYIKMKNLDERTKMLAFLKQKGINAVFHYVPLHTSKAGKRYGEFVGQDVYTTKESERLIRLPMYYELQKEDCAYIIASIYQYFGIGDA